MADLRARLTDALQLELAVRRGGLRKWAAHIADVLLSLPGIAIVELPQPDGASYVVDPEDDQFEVIPIQLSRDPWNESAERYHGCRISWGSLELNLVDDHARALAAALLGAANAAEQAVTNG